MRTLLEDSVFFERRPEDLSDGKVPIRRLRKFIASLRPYDCGYDLIRIGGENDGGYLIPNDLKGISACFSPGVAALAGFEADLSARFDIPAHLADYSVEGPPEDFTPASFIKKFIGSRSDQQMITLKDWIRENRPRARSDLLLQMDIEGGEFDAILATPNRVLRRFRIITIEFHRLNKLRDPAFFRLIDKTVQKLLRLFVVVHLHPNNSRNLKDFRGVLVPPVLEATFLRMDRVRTKTPVTSFPHPLDAKNAPKRPDLVLPENWYLRD